MNKKQKTVKIPFTKKERDLVYEMIKTHIIWGEGGCLDVQGDEKKTNNRYTMASKILNKVALPKF